MKLPSLDTPSKFVRYFVFFRFLLNLIIFSAFSVTAHSAILGVKYGTWVADMSVSGSSFRPGDTLTANIQCVSAYYCQNMVVGCPGAVSATVNGEQAPNVYAFNYDHFFDAIPHPVPIAPSYWVSIPGGIGSHTVTFKLADDAAAEWTQYTGGNGITQISGPWVILNRPQYQMWAVYVPIQILPASGKLSVSKKHTTPQENGVKPGQTMTFELSAKAPRVVKKITVTDTLPRGVSLLPDQLPAGATISGRTLKWTVSNTNSLTASYQVKVDEFRALPRGIRNLSSTVSATAQFDRSTQRATGRSNVPLILPYVVKGTVKDIVFNFKNSILPRVNQSIGGRGLTISLYEFGGGPLVESRELDPGGRFDLVAGEPGRYELRISSMADRFDSVTDSVVLNGTTLQIRHPIEIPAGHPAEKPFEEDVWLPRSLWNHVVQQLKDLREFKASKLNFAGFDFDINGLLRADLPGLENDGRYKVDAVLALMEKVRDSDFISLKTGEPAPFKRFYDGSGDRDGWNALIRMSAMIEMMRLRQRECSQLTDGMARIVSAAITVQILTKLPQFVSRSREQKGLPTAPFTPLTDAQRKAKIGKIGTMAFGIGALLPAAIDLANMQFGLNINKAMWMEIAAKATRYGMDLINLAVLRNDLKEDFIFEVVFNTMRLGVLVLVNKLYVENTQFALDGTADFLATGAYAVSTRAVFQSLEQEDKRVNKRTESIREHFLGTLAGLTSFMRGAAGILAVSGKLLDENTYKMLGMSRTLLDAPTVKGRDPMLQNGKPVLDNDGNPRFRPTVYSRGDAATLSAYIVVVSSVIYDHIWRIGDLTKMSAMIGPGSQVARNRSPGSQAPAYDALTIEPYKRSAGAVSLEAAADQSTPEAPYPVLLARLKKLADRNNKEAFISQAPAAAAAQDEFVDLIEHARNRLLAAVPLQTGTAQRQSYAFINLASAYASSMTLASEIIDHWLAEPTKTNARLAARSLANCSQTAAVLWVSLQNALSLGEGFVLDTGLFMYVESYPDRLTARSGAPFTHKIVVQNVSDITSAAGTIALKVKPGIEVSSQTTQNMPALQPGDKAEFTWTLRLSPAPASNVNFISHYQCEISQNGVLTSFYPDYFVFRASAIP